MIERILSKLFPPKFPSLPGWAERGQKQFDEQGCAGNVQPKQYRNGIDRYFQQEAFETVQNYLEQYHRQLIEAQKWGSEMEQELVSQGYVNTIHDCWEQK